MISSSLELFFQWINLNSSLFGTMSL